MMDEELRPLLEQIDPMLRNESIDSLRYRTQMESIINTAHDTPTLVSDAAGLAAVAISTAAFGG